MTTPLGSQSTVVILIEAQRDAMKKPPSALVDCRAFGRPPVSPAFAGCIVPGRSAPANGQTRPAQSLKRFPGPATACLPPRGLSLFRVLWLRAAGSVRSGFTIRRLANRARRSVLSGASTVRRPSWQASRASTADLLPGDKRLFSEAQVPQPARPSVMSQQLKSCTRQARGSTAAATTQIELGG
jgi:hypothetical protein